VRLTRLSPRQLPALMVTLPSIEVTLHLDWCFYRCVLETVKRAQGAAAYRERRTCRSENTAAGP